MKKLDLKDIMNVGIFVVVYYVAFFASICLGYFPPAMAILSLISGLVCGIPFMLFLTKIKKPASLLLFGIICGLISLAMGSGILPLIFAVVLSVIGEILLYCFKYVPSAKYIIVYIVFTLWNVGYGLRLMLASSSTYVESLNDSYGEEYVGAMLDSVFSFGFAASVLICAVGGLLGGILGYFVFRKHFVKSKV